MYDAASESDLIDRIAPAPETMTAASKGDDRFYNLLGPKRWAGLPPSV